MRSLRMGDLLRWETAKGVCLTGLEKLVLPFIAALRFVKMRLQIQTCPGDHFTSVKWSGE
jgi:hypothetical protein